MNSDFFQHLVHGLSNTCQGVHTSSVGAKNTVNCRVSNTSSTSNGKTGLIPARLQGTGWCVLRGRCSCKNIKLSIGSMGSIGKPVKRCIKSSNTSPSLQHLGHWKCWNFVEPSRGQWWKVVAMATDNTRLTGLTGKGKAAAKIPAPGRDTRGRFLPGASANPKGRPLENVEVKELARAQGPAAIIRLTQLMHCDDPQTCIAAAKALLDRGFGRPEQTIAVDATVTPTITYPAMADMDPNEAARVYAEIMQTDANVTFLPPSGRPKKEIAAAAVHPPAALPKARQELITAPEPIDIRFPIRSCPQETIEITPEETTARDAAPAYDRAADEARDKLQRHLRPPLIPT